MAEYSQNVCRVEPDNKFGRVEGIPEGEPCFVLRAKDAAAPSAVEAYKRICRSLGSPQGHLDAIEAQVQRLYDWQHDHPDSVKVPD